MPDVKKTLFNLWEKSPNLKLMAIRAMASDSDFRSITKTWDLKQNFNWENIFLDDLKCKGLKLLDEVIIPCTVEVPDFMIYDLARWIQTFVTNSGKISDIILILKTFKNTGEIFMRTDDIYYFVVRK